MLVFDFLKEGLGLVSPPRSVHAFSRKTFVMIYYIKDPLLGLRQFLAIESPLKMMKKAFCFMTKALFVRKGYLRFKTILCYKVALDVQLMNFFI